jgi:hypothetical protein
MAGAWIAAIITEAFVVVTAITVLWPGAINAWFGQSYSVKANWGVSRTFFESVALGAFGAMIAIGILFWVAGERSRRRGLVGTVASSDRGNPPERLTGSSGHSRALDA